ncbi:MAG: DoxX family protein [Pseudomonadales bacterium]|nr:DoxX family protein [Pseudomonadales bacterium]
MNPLFSAFNNIHNTTLKGLIPLDGIPPLLFRLFLSPIMIQAGWTKYTGFESTLSWFANPDWGLGLPFPELMLSLVILAELGGGILLLMGLATRWVCIPLMVTMLVAIFSVHIENGWLALSDASSWLANDRIMEAISRKAKAIEILKEHSNYSWITARGSITILNNGIEFAATYFIMLVSLLFTGAGRFFSLDYWIHRKFN